MTNEARQHCDLFGNGSDDECGGPMFSDPQPEGIDLRVCAFHTLMNRNDWVERAALEHAHVIALQTEVSDLEDVALRLLRHAEQNEMPSPLLLQDARRALAHLTSRTTTEAK